MRFQSHYRLRAAILAIAVACAGPIPLARAADVTEAQAREVAEQLRAWIGGLLGGKVPLPPGLFSIAPAGELYRLSIPAPPGTLVLQDKDGKPTGALYNATLRPLGGTRWGIESLQMPAVITLAPEAAKGLADNMGAAGGGPAGQPGDSAKVETTPAMEIRIGEQSASGVYDSSLQTESRLEVLTRRIGVRSLGLGRSGQTSEGSLDRFAGVFQLKPTSAGGVDAISDWTMEGYAGTSTDPALGELKIGVQRARMRGSIDALMTTQLATLLRTAIEMGVEASAGTKPDAQPDEARRARLLTVIATLKGLLTGASFEETVEGLGLEAMGMSGGADRFAFAIGGGMRADKFGAFIELGLDGVQSTAVPPQFAELLPRSIGLRPVVANIDVVALTALGEEATDPKADPAQIEAKLKELLMGSGVTLGIERALVDLGVAKLTATGNLTAIRPMVATGKAEIVMTGYDALMEKVQKMPEAVQVIPFLALARGLARAEGDRLVWHLDMAEDQKITINGVDLRKLGGGK